VFSPEDPNLSSQAQISTGACNKTIQQKHKEMLFQNGKDYTEMCKYT
jgi:hypothetical protein